MKESGMKKNAIMLLGGIGLAWTMPQLSAEKLIISTRDRGDGTPGLGADAWASETSDAALKKKTGTGKAAGIILVRCSANNQDTAFIRFDLINSDCNGVVTIMIQGANNSSQYAAKESSEGLPAPTLELEILDENTIG